MTWYAHIDISTNDLELVRNVYTDKLFHIEDHEYGPLIQSSRFGECKCAKDVKSRADKLLANLNVALKRAQTGFEGIRLRGVAEKTNRGFNWTVFAEPAHIAISGGVVKTVVTDKLGNVVEPPPPPRTFAERMTELMFRESGFAEAAQALNSKPVSWSQLNLVYETIKGLASPSRNKSDWNNLVALGWISEDDSNRFYETAKHYRHGHPRDPIKHQYPMPFEEAERLIDRLFVHLVDHLQPH